MYHVIFWLSGRHVERRRRDYEEQKKKRTHWDTKIITNFLKDNNKAHASKVARAFAYVKPKSE